MPTRRPGVHWNRETVAEAIARWHREHGATPNAKTWIYAGVWHPTSQTVRRVFGDWEAALEAAAELDGDLRRHLEQEELRQRRYGSRRVARRRYGLRWTPELITYAMRIWYRRNGRLPTPHDWRLADEDHPSDATVTRVFGSWASAISYAGPLIEKSHPERLSA
jgi:hypothetical protein